MNKIIFAISLVNIILLTSHIQSYSDIIDQTQPTDKTGVVETKSLTNEEINKHNEKVLDTLAYMQAQQDQLALLLKAEKEEKNKNYPKAFLLYDAAIKLIPADGTAYFDRGLLYKRLNKNKLANKDFKAALTRFNNKINANPDDYFGYLYRAGLYNEIGETDRAISDYNHCCEKGIELGCSGVEEINNDIKRGSKWVKYGQNDKIKFFYDKTSIVRAKNKTLKVWLRDEQSAVNYMDYLKQQKIESSKYGEYSYTLMLNKIDCSSQESGLITMSDYDINGKVINTFSYDKIKMDSAPPDSIISVLINELCNKPELKK